MKIVDNVALIENRLLCAAIWGDESCVNKAPRFSGYVNASIDEAGKAFIEYCIAKIYGIFRLPQCGYDNYLSGRCNYNSLDANEVTDACNEMESVIKHVQRMLAQSERSVNGKIEAVRCLSRFQIETVVRQIKENANEIQFPVSILSSYSYDGKLDQSYPSGLYIGKHINIKECIPIDQIALWDCYVGNVRKECGYVKSMHDEECELWVVDKSINGIKKLPRDSFYYTDGLPDLDNSAISRSRSEFGKDVGLHSGLYKRRPCEYDDLFTKLVINRNIKRIQLEERSI